MRARLRSGDWITPQRMQVYAWFLCVATLLSIALLGASSAGLNDARGRPLGTDFSNVYTAGQLVRHGTPEAAYDPAQHYRQQQQLFGADTPFYGWHYPPFFLLLASVLAGLPYLVALVCWQLTTAAFYLRQQWRIVPHRQALLLAAAFPAVWVNLTHGHNGFLSAGLLAAGLALLPTRPWVAGMCLGLLAYKPQFGVLIPLALLAGGYGRSIAAAGLTVLLLSAAVTLLWAEAIWQAFLGSMEFTRTVILEQGSTGFYKLPTFFAWVRLWGGPVPLAYAVQAAMQMAAALLCWTLWRSAQPHSIKAAGLIVCCVMATPYMLDYDLMVLAPALALWAREGLKHGFAPYEKTTLALAWAMPLVARSVTQHTLIPLAQLVLLALVWLLVQRLRTARAAT